MKLADHEALKGFLLGMSTLLGWVALAIVMLPLRSAAGIEALCMLVFMAALFIGLVQWAYLVPLCLWLKRKNRSGEIKGVIIAGASIMLLNGACWGYSTVNPPSYH